MSHLRLTPCDQCLSINVSIDFGSSFFLQHLQLLHLPSRLHCQMRHHPLPHPPLHLPLMWQLQQHPLHSRLHPIVNTINSHVRIHPSVSLSMTFVTVSLNAPMAVMKRLHLTVPDLLLLVFSAMRYSLLLQLLPPLTSTPVAMARETLLLLPLPLLR